MIFEVIMSDTSSNEGYNTKVYKLKSRKNFPEWKQKTLSLAKSKGYDRFLLNSVVVKTETEIEVLEDDYHAEQDAVLKASKKRIASKAKKERKAFLRAATVLAMSVRTKDLKIINKCKGDPKEMMDALCKKYGAEEDADLNDLLNSFNYCNLKDKRRDPEDWFAKLDQLNEQLEEIDNTFAKGDKEMIAHILNNLPKAYNSIKTNIQMEDDYLDDLEEVQEKITRFWKLNFRRSHKKKKKTYQSDSSDSSSSSSSSEEDDRRTKKKPGKDKLALNVEKEQLRKSERTKLKCSHCGKEGHTESTCWAKHGKPKFAPGGSDENRTCWHCGEKGHISLNCPNVKKSKKSDEEDGEEKLNSLFIGTITFESQEEGTVKKAMTKTELKLCCKCLHSGHTKNNCPPRNLKKEKMLKSILRMTKNSDDEFVGSTVLVAVVMRTVKKLN